MLQVDLTSFLASGASSLGREAVNRATKNRTKDFFESLYQNELGSYFRSVEVLNVGGGIGHLRENLSWENDFYLHEN